MVKDKEPKEKEPKEKEPREKEPREKETKEREKTNARESILLATCHCLVAQGSEKLTLDAVAQEAGVSKGGLLYHFPSKQALLEGVLSWLLDSSTAQIAHYAEQDANSTGRWNRAHVNAGMNSMNRENSKGDKMRVIASLLSVISTNHRLQSILKKHVHHWCRYLYNDGLDADTVTLMQLAVDGYFFRKMFGPELSDVFRDEKDEISEISEISEVSEVSEVRIEFLEMQKMMDMDYIKNLILKLSEQSIGEQSIGEQNIGEKKA